MRRDLLPLALLLGAVLVSATAVVYARHESRALFMALDTLERERDELNIEWGRLQLEQSAWATHGRVEEIAAGKLGMVMPDRSRTVVLKE